MTLFGTLLVIWGLVKEALFGKPVNSDPTQSVHVYPTILIALICAFLSITYNVKKTVRNSQSVSITKPLQSSAKSKLKQTLHCLFAPSSLQFISTNLLLKTGPKDNTTVVLVYHFEYCNLQFSPLYRRLISITFIASIFTLISLVFIYVYAVYTVKTTGIMSPFLLKDDILSFCKFHLLLAITYSSEVLRYMGSFPTV